MAVLTQISNSQLSDASQLNQYANLYKGGAVYDVKNGYGVVGDGTTDDTAAVQSCLTAAGSGKGYVVFPGDVNCSCTALTVPSGVRGIYGPGTLTQHTAGQNMLVVDSANNLLIYGLNFVGVGGTAQSSTVDNAIKGAGNSNLTISHCTFTGLLSAPTYQLGGTNIQYVHNQSWSCARGTLWRSVQRGVISDNEFRDASTPNATFTIVVMIDSLTGTGLTASSADITVANNVFKTWVNGQAICFHDGVGITVAGNVWEDCLIGCDLSTFTTGDLVQHASIVGNMYRGTNTAGATSGTANEGIGLSGQSATNLVQHVVVAGNEVYNANAVRKADLLGGITANYADDVLICGNVVNGAYSCGLCLTANLTRCYAVGNVITDTQISTGANTVKAGIYTAGATVGGRIEGNIIDSADSGLRFRDACTISIGRNVMTNCTARLTNPANAVYGDTYDGPITTVASATSAAGFNLPHGAAPTSPVNGDMWSTTAGLFIRINGVTKTVTLT